MSNPVQNHMGSVYDNPSSPGMSQQSQQQYIPSMPANSHQSYQQFYSQHNPAQRSPHRNYPHIHRPSNPAQYHHENHSGQQQFSRRQNSYDNFQHSQQYQSQQQRLYQPQDSGHQFNQQNIPQKIYIRSPQINYQYSHNPQHQPEIHQVFHEEVVQTTPHDDTEYMHDSAPSSYSQQPATRYYEQQHEQRLPVRTGNIIRSPPSTHIRSPVSSVSAQSINEPRNSAESEHEIHSYVVPPAEMYVPSKIAEDQYLPSVGSTCTVETSSSSPPIAEEADVYDFSPGNDDSEMQMPKAAPSAFAPGIALPTPMSYKTPNQSETKVRGKQVYSAVPALEEEDEEDETSPGRMISPTLKSPKINAAEQRESSVEASSTTTKKRRKQILPSTKEKECSVIVRKDSPPLKTTVKDKEQKALKSKKDETSRTVQLNKESTSSAHVQAVQRISTMKGWDRMNQWLKAAEQTGDFEKLKSLLRKCAEATITMELLLSNDTPKFIMQLSKTSKDKEINQLASSLVSRWKKVIAQKDVSKKSDAPKERDEKNDAKTSNKSGGTETKLSTTSLATSSSTESNKKNVSGSTHVAMSLSGAAKLKENSSPSGSNTKGSTTVTTVGAGSDTSKPRPKARAKISKPRSTGLEDETSNVSNVAPKRRPTGASSLLHNSQKEKANVSIIGNILAASNVPPKIQTSKRAVMLSDNFMDALEDQGPKKPKIVRKKVTTTSQQQPICNVSSIMEGGLYSDTSKNLSASRRESTFGGSSFAGDSIATDASFEARRKIRFADENGGQLVAVRFFEIEEGERMNVTKMSSEEMKHHEISNERIQGERKGLHFKPTNLPMPQGFAFRQSGNCTNLRPWNLILVDEIVELIERGVNSESKFIEERRQSTAMEAFYDAFTPLQVSEIDDDDNQNVDAAMPPKIIPLDMVSSPTLQGNAELFSNNDEMASPTPITTTSSSIITSLPLPFSTSVMSPSPSSSSALSLPLPFSASSSSFSTFSSLSAATQVSQSSSPPSFFTQAMSSVAAPSASSILTQLPLPFTKSLPALSDNDCDIDYREVTSPESKPELEDEDENMEDTDIRCIPVERSKDDTDDEDSLKMEVDEEENGGTDQPSDCSGNNESRLNVNALMNQLRSSGIMRSTNLADILSKVKNTIVNASSTPLQTEEHSELQKKEENQTERDAKLEEQHEEIQVLNEDKNFDDISNIRRDNADEKDDKVATKPPSPLSVFQQAPGMMRPFPPGFRGMPPFGSFHPRHRHPRFPPPPPHIMGRFAPNFGQPYIMRQPPPGPFARYPPPSPMTFFPVVPTNVVNNALSRTPSPTSTMSASITPKTVGSTFTSVNSPLTTISTDAASTASPVVTSSNARELEDNKTITTVSTPRLPSLFDVNILNNSGSSTNKTLETTKTNILSSDEINKISSISRQTNNSSNNTNSIYVISQQSLQDQPSSNSLSAYNNDSSFTAVSNTGAVLATQKLLTESVVKADVKPPGISRSASPSSSNEADNQKKFTEKYDVEALMPIAKTFVKQCTYYMAGGCNYGDACRFAHGSEITAGLRKAMAAVHAGHRPSGGGVGYRAGLRGARGASNVSAVGGGVELDYDERAPARGGGRRFVSPVRRGGYGSSRRYGRRSRRSRSRSMSVSPVRTSSKRRSPSPRSSSRRHPRNSRSANKNRRHRSSRSASNSSSSSNVSRSSVSSRDHSTQQTAPATVAEDKTTVDDGNDQSETTAAKIEEEKCKKAPHRHRDSDSAYRSSKRRRRRSRSRSSSTSDDRRRRHGRSSYRRRRRSRSNTYSDADDYASRRSDRYRRQRHGEDNRSKNSNNEKAEEVANGDQSRHLASGHGQSKEEPPAGRWADSHSPVASTAKPTTSTDTDKKNDSAGKKMEEVFEIGSNEDEKTRTQGRSTSFKNVGLGNSGDEKSESIDIEIIPIPADEPAGEENNFK